MSIAEEFKLKPIPKSRQSNRKASTKNLKRASQYKDISKILTQANRTGLDTARGKLHFPNVLKKGSIR
jgi:hypothetical protein